MKTVVDTSAWIEWFIGSPTADELTPLLPEPQDWIVPTIVQLELAKWLTREVGEDSADEVIAFSSTCHVVPLNTQIALLASEMTREHKLATADAIVFATAQSLRGGLITCDAHFQNLPNTQYIPKATD